MLFAVEYTMSSRGASTAPRRRPSRRRRRGRVGRLQTSLNSSAAVGLLVVREDGRQVVVAQALLHRPRCACFPLKRLGRAAERGALAPAHARVVGAVVVVAEGRAADALSSSSSSSRAPSLPLLSGWYLRQPAPVVARAVGALVVLEESSSESSTAGPPAPPARPRDARRAAELAFALALHLDFAGGGR